VRDDQSASPSRGRESDRFIVPRKPPKEPPVPAGTRRAEGRDRLEGILREMAKVRTQSREPLPPNLQWVKEAARRDKKARFTALLHHVNVEALQRAFRRMKRSASPGVDGETVGSYERDLGDNLKDLCARLHTGRYRPEPVRRAYIPKPDGGQRPLGVPTLEDKIVQSAVSEVLNVIYEEDFLGFSYGFRPGRNPHQALDMLRWTLLKENVNWVLDADIRRFFDSVDHEWMMRMLSHRIADRRVLRLVSQWLKAGVLESGEWRETDEGTPQGSCISPLLANLFLHHVLDLWAHHWRKRFARGRVIIVRYADDFVMGFQYEDDGRRFLEELKARLGKFGLALHEGKTRLIEFGTRAAQRRLREGQKRPGTFSFLGFTHYVGKTRAGWLTVRMKTEGKRLTRKIKAVREEAWRRMHAPVEMQHAWLSSVLKGHYAYFGTPGNMPALQTFYLQVLRGWLRCLKRRSQNSRMTWDRLNLLLDVFPLPRPRITHPGKVLAA